MAAECGQQRRSYCKDVRELEDKDRKRREKEAVVRGEQTRQIGSPETRPGGRRGADMGEVVKQKSKWDVVVCLFLVVCLWCASGVRASGVPLVSRCLSPPGWPQHLDSNGQR